MKRTKILIIFLSVSMICVIFTCSAFVYASSPPDTYHDGIVAGQGAILGGDGIVAESLSVSFDFNQNLTPYEETGASSYRGSVTSEYMLFNESGADETFTFYALYGDVPDYFTSEPQQSTRVCVDGVETEGDIRYTLRYDGVEEKDYYISAINGLTTGEGYVQPDTALYVQTYRVTVQGDSAQGKLAVLRDYDGVLPLISPSVFSNVSESNERFVYFDIQEGDTFTVCSVGAPLTGEIWAVADGTTDVFNHNYKEGEVSLESMSETTLGSYVREKTGAEGRQLSDCCACISADIAAENFKVFNESWLFIQTNLQWKEIPVTVPAGQRVTLTVTEPFFPSIYENGGYKDYITDYDVVGFKRAEAFRLRVDINTPFAVRGTTDLRPSDTGYYFDDTGYIKSSFGFRLTDSASGSGYPADEKFEGGYGIVIGILLYIFLPILMIIFILLGIFTLLMIPVAVVFSIIIIIKLIIAIVKKVRDRKNKNKLDI